MAELRINSKMRSVKNINGVPPLVVTALSDLEDLLSCPIFRKQSGWTTMLTRAGKKGILTPVVVRESDAATMMGRGVKAISYDNLSNLKYVPKNRPFVPEKEVLIPVMFNAAKALTFSKEQIRHLTSRVENLTSLEDILTEKVEKLTNFVDSISKDLAEREKEIKSLHERNELLEAQREALVNNARKKC